MRMGKYSVFRTLTQCNAAGGARLAPAPLALAAATLYSGDVAHQTLQTSDSAFFGPELFAFLRQLKRHNDREWFNRNKARYEQVIVERALQFIQAFGPHLRRISPHFVADPRPARGSLFRIYRDTRFAADKRPYKTHVGIHFAHEKGKDVHVPAFYLHLEPENCFTAAGIWHPDNPALSRIRAAIVGRSSAWGAIHRKFELEGDALLRPPRGFDPEHPFIEDIKRKDFIASVTFTDAQVCGPKFMADFTRSCRTMVPLVEFTAKALGLEF
jgi:uncharacterized protein (TIGR02453 family)